MSYKDLLKGKFCHRLPTLVLFWNQWSFLSSKKRKINVSKLLFYVQSSSSHTFTWKCISSEQACICKVWIRLDYQWMMMCISVFSLYKDIIWLQEKWCDVVLFGAWQPLDKVSASCKTRFCVQLKRQRLKAKWWQCSFSGGCCTKNILHCEFLHYVVDIQLAK